MPTSPEPGARSPALLVGLFILAIAAVALGVWGYNNRALFSELEVAPTAEPEPIDPSAETPPADSTVGAKSDAPSVAPRPVSRARVEPPAEPRATAAVPAVPASVEPPAQPPATVPTVPASVEPPVTPVVPSPVPADPTPLTAPLASAADTRTYDATSVDVAPPALLTPVANAPLRAGSRQSPGSVAIEIMVNDDGSIASVKATSEPTTIAETLQVFNGLSIAKSWQFDPALRNGQPVKYRLLVPLSTFVIR